MHQPDMHSSFNLVGNWQMSNLYFRLCTMFNNCTMFNTRLDDFIQQIKKNRHVIHACFCCLEYSYVCNSNLKK